MSAQGEPRLILDDHLPSADAAITEHVRVAADPGVTYQAVTGLDLLTVRTPILVIAMWLRGLPARLTGRALPAPPALLIGAGVGLPGWTILGEESGHEIVIGAVGKFWQPVIEWRSVAAADFAEYDVPGWAKLAVSFTVTEMGDGSLVSYHCRTSTTDERARRRFRRYWWLIRPFVANIMRATLRTIKTEAESVPRQ